MRLSSIKLRTKGMPDYGLKIFKWQGKGLYARLNNTVGATGANNVVFFINSLLAPMSIFGSTEFDNSPNSAGETGTYSLWYQAYTVTYYKMVLHLTNLDTTHVVWVNVFPNEYSSTFIASTDLNDTPPYINRPGSVQVRLAPNGSSGNAKTLVFKYGIGKAGGLKRDAITTNPDFGGTMATVPTAPVSSIYACMSMRREDGGTSALNVAMQADISFYTKLEQRKPNVVV